MKLLTKRIIFYICLAVCAAALAVLIWAVSYRFAGSTVSLPSAVTVFGMENGTVFTGDIDGNVRVYDADFNELSVLKADGRIRDIKHKNGITAAA